MPGHIHICTYVFAYRHTKTNTQKTSDRRMKSDLQIFVNRNRIGNVSATQSRHNEISSLLRLFQSKSLGVFWVGK